MTCRCTLHPRRDHKDPCKACAANHVRLARTRLASSVLGVRADGAESEGSALRAVDVTGPSPDPALAMPAASALVSMPDHPRHQ